MRILLKYIHNYYYNNKIPCEETINEILERYKSINDHAASYTWKRLGKPIDMERTLE